MGILARCFCLSDSLSQQQAPTLIEELCHRFSLAQLQKSTNNFHQGQMIATGYSVVVYKATINIASADYTVAIKRLRNLPNQPKSHPHPRLSELKHEIQLLCQLRHSNLPLLIGFCDEKDEMILVYEYLANGSLSHHLHNNVEKLLSWKQRLKICIGAARGLHYLHSGAKCTIFHRDMKSSNILLDQNWVPKLADFGVSLQGPRKEKVKPIEIAVDAIVGTCGYMAPEYAMYGKVTDKVDVYSFGMILLEVVCAKKLHTINCKIEEEIKEEDQIRNRVGGDDDYYETDESDDYLEAFTFKNLAKEVREFVQNGNADKIVDPFLMGKIAAECWELFMDIAERCLLEEPSERPAMGEVQVELENVLQLQEQAEGKDKCDTLDADA